MSLDAAISPPDGLASGRFFRTGYLPTYAATLFLLVLIWAGAPLQRIHFGRAWKVAEGLSVVETVLIVLGIILVAVVMQPLQSGLVRVLEGGLPRWLGAGLALRWHCGRRERLARRSATVLQQAAEAGEEQRRALMHAAGAAAERLRARYPSGHLVRPTKLGNVLTATADNAGAEYGLDPVVAWPRLYPLLPEATRGMVDDLRDGLDAAARMSVVCGLTAMATAALLAPRSGWWTLLALLPLAIAVASYAGAVRAAVAYGESIQVAIDLHRFDLLAALRLPMPADLTTERAANRALCDFLRQGVPLRQSYRHPASALTTAPVSASDPAR